MDLRTFVAETLTQIVGGVADAKAAIDDMDVGAKVNPDRTYSDKQHGEPTDVEFDVAVTVASAFRDGKQHEAGASASGVLAVVGLTVSGKVAGDETNEAREEAVSRVKFKVKLAQPAHVEKRQRTPTPTPTIPRTARNPYTSR